MGPLFASAVILGTVNAAPQEIPGFGFARAFGNRIREQIPAGFSIARTFGDTIKEQIDMATRLLEQFEAFIFKYGKSYASTAEKLMRFEIFKDNLKFIDLMNARSDGSVTYGVNSLADMSYEEFKARNRYRGGNRAKDGAKRVRRDAPKRRFTGQRKYFDDESGGGLAGNKRSREDFESGGNSSMYAGSFDRGKIGKGGFDLTSPLYPECKDQKNCGSCYAFAVAGAIEIVYAKQRRKILDLSEQEIVDCSQPFGNAGCDGGDFTETFKFIKNRSLTSESQNPYVGKETKICKRAKGVVSVKSWSHLKGRANILAALKKNKALLAGVNADSRAFQVYKKGVMKVPTCDPNVLDHAVVIVGFRIEKGQTIYDVRNSWGTKWGERKGHFQIANNDCGIEMDVWSFDLA
nr:PREDICTED: digestive cysteine proteinase 2-like [Bemisia tabaci]